MNYLSTKNNALINQGTYPWWKSLLTDVGPKIIYLIDNIVLPRIDELCIQAFGQFYSYNRPAADLLPLFTDKNGEKVFSGFTFKLLVVVDIIKGFTGKSTLVQQDEQFFLTGISTIPGIIVDTNSVKMIPKKGHLIFSFNIPIGEI